MSEADPTAGQTVTSAEIRTRRTRRTRRIRRTPRLHRIRLATPAAALAAGGVALALLVAEFPLSGLAHQNVGQAGGGGSPLVLSAPFAVIGFFLAWRKPGNRLGWILLGLGASSALAEDASFYVVAGYSVRHGGLPFGWVALLVQPTWSVTVVLIGLAILLFPDGYLPSRRLRWMLWVYLALGAAWMAGAFSLTVVAITRHQVRLDSSGNLLMLDHPTGSAAWWGVAQNAVILAIVVSWLVSLTAQMVSYRRSSGERRQQLKWLLGGSVTALLGVFLRVLLSSSPGLPNTIGDVCILLAIFALPASMAVAILKYRLYDIDRIISRTVAYAIVTGLLVGVYVGLVLLATQVFSLHGPVAVAAATLAAAALFSPLRRRVQRMVDRRFNRAKYDSDRTVAAFAVRLKDAVDLDTIRDDLSGVVQSALEPAHVWVWTSPHE